MRMFGNFRFAAGAFVVGMVTVVAVPASAAVNFSVFGVNVPGVSADVSFGYDSSAGKITIDITNTADAILNPFAAITAFTFNAPANVTGLDLTQGVDGFTASGTLDDSAWAPVFDPDSVNTPGNFGQFDVAGTTGNEGTGGSPNDGIALGATGTFMFWLTGTNLNTLNESSFLSLLSDPNNPQSDTQPFLVRFQQLGTNGEGSDVGIVPLPAALPLFLAGLAGLGFVGWRRRAA